MGAGAGDLVGHGGFLLDQGGKHDKHDSASDYSQYCGHVNQCLRGVVLEQLAHGSSFRLVVGSSW